MTRFMFDPAGRHVDVTFPYLPCGAIGAHPWGAFMNTPGVACFGT